MDGEKGRDNERKHRPNISLIVFYGSTPLNVITDIVGRVLKPGQKPVADPGMGGLSGLPQ